MTARHIYHQFRYKRQTCRKTDYIQVLLRIASSNNLKPHNNLAQYEVISHHGRTLLRVLSLLLMVTFDDHSSSKQRRIRSLLATNPSPPRVSIASSPSQTAVDLTGPASSSTPPP
jgi:hypothetical protein